MSALIVLCTPVLGQAVPIKPAETAPVATSTPSRESEIPDVPGISSEVHGLNAGITFGGIHDSVTGWATLVTPALGYSFNSVFSVDLSMPVYFFRLAPTTAARPRPKDLLLQERGETGDVFLAAHMQLAPAAFQYQATVALALPTGSARNGLTTGRVSFDVANRFEHTFQRFSPNVEIGMGDSNTLVNHVNTQNYTELGPLAHFQLGIGVPLLFGASFDSAVYEQLPVGDQKAYGPSRNGRTLVVTGRRLSEDNGFISSLDVPVSRHMSFSGYYNRSLRYHADAVSVGFTYVLRAAPTDDEILLNSVFR